MTDVLSEARRIKDAMRKCTSPEELEEVASQERETVRQMHRAGGESETMAIQIINLKAYLIGNF